jgi:AraC family transcriptional regulator
MFDNLSEISNDRLAPGSRIRAEPGICQAPAFGRPTRAKGGLSRRQERRATAFLTANVGGTVTIGDVAAECGLSPSHFSRAFRETTGKPPHRWLIEHRVARAKELLLQSNLPIVEIAADCGFADQSHLTRLFTNLAGVPPGTWRRRFRE